MFSSSICLIKLFSVKKPSAYFVSLSLSLLLLNNQYLWILTRVINQLTYQSLNRLLKTQSIIHLITQSLTQSLNHSIAYSITQLLYHLITNTNTQSFNHLITLVLTQSLTYSKTLSLTYFLK